MQVAASTIRTDAYASDALRDRATSSVGLGEGAGRMTPSTSRGHFTRVIRVLALSLLLIAAMEWWNPSEGNARVPRSDRCQGVDVRATHSWPPFSTGTAPGPLTALPEGATPSLRELSWIQETAWGCGSRRDDHPGGTRHRRDLRLLPLGHERARHVRAPFGRRGERPARRRLQQFHAGP